MYSLDFDAMTYRNTDETIQVKMPTRLLFYLGVFIALIKLIILCFFSVRCMFLNKVKKTKCVNVYILVEVSSSCYSRFNIFYAHNSEIVGSILVSFCLHTFQATVLTLHICIPQGKELTRIPRVISPSGVMHL